MAVKVVLKNLPTKKWPLKKGPRSHSDDASHQSDGEGRSDVIVKEKRKSKKPPLYKVLIYNDDYTTMDFVVLVLKKYFRKTEQEASQIMLNVHREGMGICGVYTYEVAETKCQKVTLFSRQNGHPLKCTMEKE